MNNDLINREVLKNHIIEIFDEEVKHDKKWAMGLKYSIKIIDNTPAASFAISPDYVTELQNLIKELTKQLEEAERPRGIWVEDKFGDHFCSNCKTSAFYNDAGLEAETRFCPTCGADMRGEENETDN